MHIKLLAIVLPVAAIVSGTVYFRGETSADYAVTAKLATPEQIEKDTGKVISPTWAFSIVYDGAPDIIPCSKAAHDSLNVGDTVGIVTVVTANGAKVRRLLIEPDFIPPPLYKP